jgi:predicted transcriptional regulator
MKTLAIRLEPEQHVRLTILATLSGESVTELIRTAIELRLEQLALDPAIQAKADGLKAAIEEDAATRRDAIAGLFTPPPPTARKRATSGTSEAKE